VEVDLVAGGEVAQQRGLVHADLGRDIGEADVADAVLPRQRARR
jgi:hypothetical protein